jgi:DNA-binding response OmpR family regulator
VLLRRAYDPRPTPVSRVGTLTVDHRTREVRVGDRRVSLAAKEYELLQALIADPTRVYTREELLRDVWGFRTHTSTRTLDLHASRLRQKLAAAQPSRQLVINVWGIGYCLVRDLPVRDEAA